MNGIPLTVEGRSQDSDEEEDEDYNSTLQIEVNPRHGRTDENEDVVRLRGKLQNETECSGMLSFTVLS